MLDGENVMFAVKHVFELWNEQGHIREIDAKGVRRMTYDDGKGVSAPPKDWKEYLGDLLTNNQILDVIEDALRIKAEVEYKAGNVSKLMEVNQLIREIKFIRSK